MHAPSVAIDATPLIERDEELLVIEQVLGTAASGSGAAILVEGAPGIGKSALIERAAEIAMRTGMRVLTARGDLLERDFPYGIAGQLFEPALREAAPDELERLLEGSAGLAGDVLLRRESPGREASTLVSHALYWLAWALAEERPLLLIVDDAHWADRASARALLHLARRLDDMRVALIVALRPAEPDSPAELTERLAVEPDTTRIALQPLSEIGSAGLVRRWNSAADAELCARCHTASGGNPLVVRELARVVSEFETDVLGDDGSLAQGVHSPVLDRAVLRRLAGLPEDWRAATEALAILGDCASPAHVAAMAGIGVDTVSAARDALVGLGLLGEGDDLVFSHPVIRQAVEASLSRGEQARGHRRAAELLQKEGAGLDAIAAHLLLSDPGGEASTVATLRAAAQAALAQGAPDTAAVYLRRALAEPPGPDERPSVLLELGVTEFDCGLQGTAEHLRAALAGLEDHASRIEVLTRLAALEVVQEKGAAESSLFEAELEAVGREGELGLAMELAAIDVLLMLPGRQPERQERVAALPPPAAEPTPYDRVAMAHRAWVAAEIGEDCEEVRSLARAALEGDGLLEISSHRPTYHMATRALFIADALPDAEAALRRIEAAVARRGSLRMRAAVAWYLADLHLRKGHIGDAENEARLVLALHEEGDQIHCGAVEALVNALVERGELDEADAVLREHGWHGPLGDYWREVGLRIARARLALARGDGDEALAEALDCGRLRDLQGRPNPAWSPWRSTAALACVLRDDRVRARALADEELELARRFGAPRALGIALRARALSADEDDEALAFLREAGDVLADSHAELERARVMTDLGATLRRMGDLDQAREPLRTALSEADRLGATALAARAREELVAAGLRPRRAPISGVAALTPRQRRVCDLAAAGCTNRAIAQELFVTVKTVETHLLAAYRKLGIASKSELAAALGSVES